MEPKKLDLPLFGMPSIAAQRPKGELPPVDDQAGRRRRLVYALAILLPAAAAFYLARRVSGSNVVAAVAAAIGVLAGYGMTIAYALTGGGPLRPFLGPLN